MEIEEKEKFESMDEDLEIPLGTNIFTIYKYKFVISLFVCLYVRSKLRNTWTDLPQILIGELKRATGMFLAWF